jgi:hypothetical protein
MKTILFFLLSFSCYAASSQIASFNFSGSGTCPTQGNTPISPAAHVTVTPFSRASLTCVTSQDVFNSKDWTIGSTINTSQYIEVTATAEAGYILNLSSVSFKIANSSTGPTSARIAHNAAGSFSTTQDITVGTSYTTVSFDFADITTDPGAAVSFRIYGWNNTSSGGTMRITDFFINGSVSASQILTYDFVNKRVGVNIGTGNSPAATLQVGDGSANKGTIYVKGTKSDVIQEGANLNFGDATLQQNASGGLTAWTYESGWKQRLFINGSSGNIGIGGISPLARFHVNAGTDRNILFRAATDFALGIDGMGIQSVNDAGNANLPIEIESSTLYLNPGTQGAVLIGNHDLSKIGTHKLIVNGSILSTKAVVKLNGNWPDYVFKPDYKLRPLPEVESYIKQYSHLPEVTSAADAEKNGIDLGASQAELLKKVEELTLYMIATNKKLEDQQQQIEQLKKKLDKAKKNK